MAVGPKGSDAPVRSVIRRVQQGFPARTPLLHFHRRRFNNRLALGIYLLDESVYSVVPRHRHRPLGRFRFDELNPIVVRVAAESRLSVTVIRQHFPVQLVAGESRFKRHLPRALQ